MKHVTRTQWGAQPPKRAGYVPDHPVRYAILHHEGGRGGPPASLQAGMERVAAIQNYHLNHPEVDYRDIAYSSLVDEHASYQGRPWREAPGATRGHNAASKAVCALGNFDRYAPPDALLDNLAGELVRLWRLGAIDTPAFDGGHRDFGSSSSCPGSLLYPHIPEINRRASIVRAAGDVEEVDMTPQQEKMLAEVHRQLTEGTWDRTPAPYEGAARTVRDRVWQTAQIASVDVDALADEIAARIDGADRDEIRRAVQSVFADAADG